MAKLADFIPSALGALPSCGKPDLSLVRSKGRIFNSRVAYMLLRCMEIFEWKNLPKTLDPRVLELYLLTQGYALIVKCDESNSDCKEGDEDKPSGIYALAGGLGGQLDASYFPTLGIPVSPYLNLAISSDEDRRLGKKIALVRNDSNIYGLMGLFALYAGEQADAFMTLRLQLVNLRVNKILQADSDTARDDAKTYLKRVDEDGELGVIGSKRFLDNVLGLNPKDASTSATTPLKDTIEAIQFLDGKWFTELGLNANYNMKRESLNDDEVGAGEDTLFPLIDNMLEWRKKGAEDINRIFGTSIEVELKSSWKKVMEERELTLRQEVAELKATLATVQSEKEALELEKQTRETSASSEETSSSSEDDSSSEEGAKEEKEE